MNAGLVNDAVWLVLDALPTLVAHDVLLIGERGGRDLLEQIPHAIRLEPQRELDLVGGNGLEIVRAIEIRGAVQIAGAGAFQQLDVLIRRNVLRPLKHHVLEQMRETGAPRLFVGGADVVPEVDGDERQPVVLRQDHAQPVWQRIRFVLDVGDIGRSPGPGRRGLRQNERHRKGRRDRGAENGAKASHGFRFLRSRWQGHQDRTIL